MKTTCALFLLFSPEQSWTVRDFSLWAKKKVSSPFSITNPQFMNEAFSGNHHLVSEQFQEEINHLSSRKPKGREHAFSSPKCQWRHWNNRVFHSAAAFGLGACTAAAHLLQHFLSCFWDASSTLSTELHEGRFVQGGGPQQGLLSE